MTNFITRPDIPYTDISLAINELQAQLRLRLKQHGTGAYASSHELSGVLDEEVREFKDYMHSNDRPAQRDELMDIAVACIIGWASLLIVYDDAERDS